MHPQCTQLSPPHFYPTLKKNSICTNSSQYIDKPFISHYFSVQEHLPILSVQNFYFYFLSSYLPLIYQTVFFILCPFSTMANVLLISPAHSYLASNQISQLPLQDSTQCIGCATILQCSQHDRLTEKLLNHSLIKKLRHVMHEHNSNSYKRIQIQTNDFRKPGNRTYS